MYETNQFLKSSVARIRNKKYNNKYIKNALRDNGSKEK